MKCEKCGEEQVGMPCPDNKEGCCVFHYICGCTADAKGGTDDRQ